MGIADNLLEKLADRLGKHIQGDSHAQSKRDNRSKGTTYSVEAEISEALADLILMFSTVPVDGDSERAKWLDAETSRFLADHAKQMVTAAFMEGDCLVVPSWNGRNVQNVVVPSSDFVVTGCYGREITSCAYVIDRKTLNGQEYTLMQAVELVPYSAGGRAAFANRYRVYVAQNGAIAQGGMERFPEWEERYRDSEWFVPNVERLLVARFRSHAIDPNDPNAVKGVPICFGAGAAIAEIHYLLDRMHDEFELSEKFVFADKRMFKKEWRGSDPVTVLPRGKERVIVDVQGHGEPGGSIGEWSPDIRQQAYLDAIDKQEQLVERAVGVSSGIISRPNDMNYQNVDNVRKSQQKTMAFVSTARRGLERTFSELVYAWDVLANFYGITPMGAHELSFDWSDEYVETFADRQNALLAGETIGATDAVDYRMYVMNESPEVARERVAEIKAGRDAEPVLTPFAAA